MHFAFEHEYLSSWKLPGEFWVLRGQLFAQVLYVSK